MNIVRSSIRTIIALSFLWSIGFAMPAQACRNLVLQPAKLAEYATVALTTVEIADRIDNPGWNTWIVTTKVEKVIIGSSARTDFTVRETLSSDGCGTTPLPSVGEKWVIYTDHSGRNFATRGYPLALAKEYDPRLAEVN